jgi:hypothetical protein
LSFFVSRSCFFSPRNDSLLFFNSFNDLFSFYE